MRIPRIYVDQALEVSRQVELSSDRAHYVSNVLRLAPGRRLIVFNGQGGEFRAELLQAGKKQAVIRLDDYVDQNRESPLDVELAIGLSRGDRMDWIVQKATELGVTRISPLYAERTEVKLRGPRLDKKMQHWKQIAVGACEQCQRNRLPELSEPMALSDFLAQCNSERKLLLHPDTENPAVSAEQNVRSVAVLVGPEGGFGEAEVALAKESQFETWQLGPRILRTETAPIAVLALLQHCWGDW